jgi:hypothetical protein
MLLFVILRYYSVATLALGSRPRQNLARAWAKREVEECENEHSHSQMNSHAGSWSPCGLSKYLEID